VTYRLGDHTTADDSSRYRNPKEVEEWKKKDPIERLRRWMKAKGVSNENYEKEVLRSAEEKVEKAVKDYEAVPAQSPEDIVKYTFGEMTWNLKDQLKQLGDDLLKQQSKQSAKK
jgi:pyruvate dehydrogenase E1 component alpha subunit